MTTLIDDGPVLPEQRFDISSSPLPPEPERRTEFRLLPGERYGWWTEHDPEEEKRQAAVVHGAVNDSRTQIILDTGAKVSVPTYINASAQIKITLDHRGVYVVDLWVTNIGEDVDVLLGVDFMFSAGVRLCIRKGLMVLPDEESILMNGDISRKRHGRDLPITPSFGLHLRPGESATVRIRYDQGNPLRDVVWAGRGDRWVILILYGAKSWATAVNVVNISERDVWIDSRTPVARIIEYGDFPSAGRFVRPGLRWYQEWQHLIFESTVSAQARLRAERFTQMFRDAEPPAVQTPQRRRVDANAARAQVLVDVTTETGESLEYEGAAEPAHLTLSTAAGGLLRAGYSSVLLERLRASDTLRHLLDGQDDAWAGELPAFDSKHLPLFSPFPAVRATAAKVDAALSDELALRGTVCLASRFDAAAGECLAPKAECGFCKFMKAGPCGEQFTAWEACLDRCKKSGHDFIEQCGPQTLALRDCVDANPEYYHVLNDGPEDETEQAAEEQTEDAKPETGDNASSLLRAADSPKQGAGADLIPVSGSLVKPAPTRRPQLAHLPAGPVSAPKKLQQQDLNQNQLSAITPVQQLRKTSPAVRLTRSSTKRVTKVPKLAFVQSSRKRRGKYAISNQFNIDGDGEERARQVNAGVYLLENAKTGHRYFGTTWDLHNAAAQSFHDLQLGVHPHQALSTCFKLYGEAASGIRFRVLEHVSPPSSPKPPSHNDQIRAKRRRIRRLATGADNNEDGFDVRAMEKKLAARLRFHQRRVARRAAYKIVRRFLVVPVLAQAWPQWVRATEGCVHIENIAACMEIQRVARGYIARVVVANIRRDCAARTLQRFLRYSRFTLACRRRARALQESKAACVLQRTMREFVSRRKARRRRDDVDSAEWWDSIGVRKLRLYFSASRGRIKPNEKFGRWEWRSNAQRQSDVFRHSGERAGCCLSYKNELQLESVSAQHGKFNPPIWRGRQDESTSQFETLPDATALQRKCNPATVYHFETEGELCAACSADFATLGDAPMETIDVNVYRRIQLPIVRSQRAYRAFQIRMKRQFGTCTLCEKHAVRRSCWSCLHSHGYATNYNQRHQKSALGMNFCRSCDALFHERRQSIGASSLLQHQRKDIERAYAEDDAAVTIQKYYRRFAQRDTLAGLQFTRQTTAAKQVQECYRRHRQRRITRAICAAHKRQKLVENNAAVVIQRAVRGYLARCELWWLKLERDCAVKIQRAFRRYQAKRIYSSAVAIQSQVRGWLARRIAATLRQERLEKQQDAAACCIQCHARGFLARRRVLHMKRRNAAVLLQSVWRGYVAKRELRRLRLEKQRKFTEELYQRLANLAKQIADTERIASTRIQTMVRGHQSRNKLYELKLEAARNAREKLRDCAVALEAASATCIQLHRAFRYSRAKRRLARLVDADSTEDIMAKPESGWVELFDEASGYVYYYHAETGESVWERPSEMDAAAWTPEDVTPNENFDEWVEYWDENVGASYFYNVKTGEATWTTPAGYQSSYSNQEDTATTEAWSQESNGAYYVGSVEAGNQQLDSYYGYENGNDQAGTYNNNNDGGGYYYYYGDAEGANGEAYEYRLDQDVNEQYEPVDTEYDINYKIYLTQRERERQEQQQESHSAGDKSDKQGQQEH
ncbi:unnamed protein product [Phytophthora fragariaefolia]|uniref:Unnamed protein product n=1 Tax=Phytophthora fragariaefolia TaxID=1490495 RepID=A0A9W6UAF6_9STRA|nr:unnamed protein product [Phytophthora fragariaefolia]